MFKIKQSFSHSTYNFVTIDLHFIEILATIFIEYFVFYTCHNSETALLNLLLNSPYPTQCKEAAVEL